MIQCSQPSLNKPILLVGNTAHIRREVIRLASLDKPSEVVQVLCPHVKKDNCQRSLLIASFFTVKFQMTAAATILFLQGVSFEKRQNEMAVTLKWFIFDLMLVKPKCV